ncbi:hypothetical protein HDE_01876 [Halotydeus destructor]|nr:hypothetical protein HDE_01876 [Halotydeus destructor]
MTSSRCLNFMRGTVIVINGLFVTGSMIAFFIGVHESLEDQEAEYVRASSPSVQTSGSTDSPEANQEGEPFSGETVIIFSLITISVALIGLIGVLRNSFLLIIIFAIIVLMTLSLRVILFISMPEQPDTHDQESRVISVFFALVEITLVVFSYNIAFDMRRRSRQRGAMTVSPLTAVQVLDGSPMVNVTIAEMTQIDEPSSKMADLERTEMTDKETEVTVANDDQLAV